MLGKRALFLCPTNITDAHACECEMNYVCHANGHVWFSLFWGFHNPDLIFLGVLGSDLPLSLECNWFSYWCKCKCSACRCSCQQLSNAKWMISFFFHSFRKLKFIWDTSDFLFDTGFISSFFMWWIKSAWYALMNVYGCMWCMSYPRNATICLQTTFVLLLKNPTSNLELLGSRILRLFKHSFFTLPLHFVFFKMMDAKVWHDFVWVTLLVRTSSSGLGHLFRVFTLIFFHFFYFFSRFKLSFRVFILNLFFIIIFFLFFWSFSEWK